MIIEYHRPQQLNEALALLSRKDPISLPIGGGTTLDRTSSEAIAVVDLQDLGLNQITLQGNQLEIGACVTLQMLIFAVETHPMETLETFRRVIRHEASYNLRQVSTLAGMLVSADGRSPLTTALLALDCTLHLEPGGQTVGLGDFLPLRRDFLRHRLITSISVPKNAVLAYEFVARSPSDLPIVCVAAASWSSGRTRLALGGYGRAPVLVMDGNEDEGAELAAASAYLQAEDQWASAEYRREIAAVLAKRAVESIPARNLPS